jgi:hypothetical protein
MAVYRFEDPGIKDSMDALAGIMQAAGSYSRQRQDHELKMNMFRVASDPNLEPEEKLKGIYDEVSNFKPQKRSGLGGIVQGFGDFFAPPSQIPGNIASGAVQDILNHGEETRQIAMDKALRSDIDSLERRKTSKANSLGSVLRMMDPRDPQYSVLMSEYSSLLGLPEPEKRDDIVSPVPESGGGVKDWGLWPWNWGGGNEKVTPQQLNEQVDATTMAAPRLSPEQQRQYEARQTPTTLASSPIVTQTPAPQTSAKVSPQVKSAAKEAADSLEGQPTFVTPPRLKERSTPVQVRSKVYDLARRAGVNVRIGLRKDKEAYDALFDRMLIYDFTDDQIIAFLRERKQ